MKKIKTLFKKNPDNLALVIDEPNLEVIGSWDEFIEYARPTRKFDGTAAAIIEGELYKRYNVKKGRNVPPNAVPCQEADKITGHHPHWVKCVKENQQDKYFFKALEASNALPDGTYELCGEKVQGNPEYITGHALIPHGEWKLDLIDFSFSSIMTFLEPLDMEGIVFYDERTNEPWCKLTKKHFGLKRNLI